jgi:hypothetical protein
VNGWFPHISTTGRIASGAGEIHLDGVDPAIDVGWNPRWIDANTIVYSTGSVTRIRNVTTGATTDVPVNYNQYQADAGYWIGLVQSGDITMHRYAGTTVLNTWTGRGSPSAGPNGDWANTDNYFGDIHTAYRNETPIATDQIVRVSVNTAMSCLCLATGTHTRKVLAYGGALWFGYFFQFSSQYGDNPTAPGNCAYIQDAEKVGVALSYGKKLIVAGPAVQASVGHESEVIGLWCAGFDEEDLEDHAAQLRATAPASLAGKPIVGNFDGGQQMPSRPIAGVDWLALECYTGANETAAACQARVHACINTLGSAHNYLLIGQSYTSNTNNTSDPQVLVETQYVPANIAKNDLRVVAILMFSDGRPTGTRDHEEWRPIHRAIYAGINQSVIDCTIEPWEDPLIIDGPASQPNWILSLLQNGLALRPVGSAGGYRWSGAVYYNPWARYLPSSGKFLIAFSSSTGVLGTLEVFPGTDPPDVLPPWTGGPTPAPPAAPRAQVAPVVRRRRQYPHVDGISDWRAQQTTRLLWDRVFDLEERLQSAEKTTGDLVGISNSQDDSLGTLGTTAGEALVLAQRSAGEPGTPTGPTEPSPPGAPTPPGSSGMPNYGATVANVLANKFVSPDVPASEAETGKAQLTRAAAWEIYQTDPRIRLFAKTSGNQVNGRSVDIIVLGTDGSYADCAAETISGATATIRATWGAHGPDLNTSNSSRWIVPTAAIAAESGPMTPK